MRHITNVLVHSNRCEVVDGHTFATGDKGLPHIHLQFLYMFGENSLQGKNLECKYLLPNGQYSAETVKITGKNEVTFPIHYSCFTVNGWTTLRITLVNGSNRVTLEDIVIKTKETKLGEPFSNTQVEEAIAQAIEVTTSSISAEGETIKEELRNYIQKEKSKLKGEKGEKGEPGERGPIGEQGPRGFTGERGPQGEKGPKGAKGDRGLTGPQGERGAGITSVMTLDDNRVLVRYGDEQSEILTIPTVSGKDGKDGKSLEFEWNGTSLGIREQGKYFYNYMNLRGPKGSNGIEGVGLRDVTLTQTRNEVTLSFSLTDSTIKERSFSLAKLKLPNYFTKEEVEKQFAPTKHSHDELLSYSEAERVFVSNSFALENFITIRNVESYCAGKNHNHDELYYTKSKIDEKLAEKSNVVKKVWSGMYTQKGGTVCSLPSGWKVVFVQISWHSDHRGATTTETLFKDTYQLKGFGVGDEGSSEYTIEIDYYDRVKFTGRG
ncbi:collagen-like protein, partial [Fusobacterium necrophorum]|uniref:collagen-like protein n=1 Tax=Fusobacterium necrophorum TaxID=859 RepID=UPI00373AF4D8